MAEHRLYPEGTVPPVSTFEFHQYRERAPHLEQGVHQPRLHRAAVYIRYAVLKHITECQGTRGCIPHPISDLGCGDGGLLSLIAEPGRAEAWGYDFQPSNAAGWKARGVKARSLDVFGADRGQAMLGLTSVTTEVLEHLADPHAAVRWIGQHSRYLVASSPWNETPESHDACHAWAWDQDGYRALIEQGGFEVLRHETVGQFQVILGERRDERGLGCGQTRSRRIAVVCATRQQFLDWCIAEGRDHRDPSLILVTEERHARGNWFDQVIEVGERRPGLFADTRSRLRPDQQ